jgi:hypothetical protein
MLLFEQLPMRLGLKKCDYIAGLIIFFIAIKAVGLTYLEITLAF